MPLSLQSGRYSSSKVDTLDEKSTMSALPVYPGRNPGCVSDTGTRVRNRKTAHLGQGSGQAGNFEENRRAALGWVIVRGIAFAGRRSCTHHNGGTAGEADGPTVGLV
jgi:hypothetical protein